MGQIKEKINRNPTLKWTVSIAGVIILGAIGSGVWQLIGEPLINFVVKITIDSMNFVINNYKDNLYSRASEGLHESAATQTYAIILALPPLLALFYILGEKAGKIGVESAEKDISEIKEKAEGSIEKRLTLLSESIKADEIKIEQSERIMYLTLVVLAVISFNSAIQVSYVNKTITYVENTLDRLSPYVDNKKILGFRAQFREVETANDYYLLYENLEIELDKNGLKPKSDEPL